MRVLFLCEYFPPENKIGAVRPSRVAKYLGRKEDLDITVVCARPHGIECPATEEIYPGVRVIRIEKSKLAGLMYRKKRGGTKSSSAATSNGQRSVSLKSRLKGSIISTLFRLRIELERDGLYRDARKLIKNEAFDVVISTFNTEFGHTVAKDYKAKHPSTKWIADFRDPTVSDWLSDNEKNRLRTFAQETARRCDAITVVAQGILDVHEKDFAGTPCYVIPNGYDPEDRVECPAPNDGMFRLVYTGELYNGRRDITPVFRALAELSEDGKVDLTRVEVVYVGKSGAVFAQQAQKYSYVKSSNRGFVPHAEAMKLQSQSQILLLSSWCTPQDKHTLTGKFFEYLSAGKPIVCTISGDGSGSALSEMIAKHKLGVCCEQAEPQDYLKLRDYLELQYRAFAENGVCEHRPDMDYINDFSYENIAERFYSLICGGNGT